MKKIIPAIMIVQLLYGMLSLGLGVFFAFIFESFSEIIMVIHSAIATTVSFILYKIVADFIADKLKINAKSTIIISIYFILLTVASGLSIYLADISDKFFLIGYIPILMQQSLYLVPDTIIRALNFILFFAIFFIENLIKAVILITTVKKKSA